MGKDFLDVLHAADISIGGVAVEVPHQFRDCAIDEEVRIVTKLPKQDAFSAKGTIRHLMRGKKESKRFGIEFTIISDRDRDRIEKYVATRMALMNAGSRS